jgi:chromosome segregation ATPase
MDESARLARIEVKLTKTNRLLEKIMSGLDDAKAAVAALTANVTALAADVQNSTDVVNRGVAEIASLAAQIAGAVNGDSDMDVEALATQITSQANAVQTANTAIQAATNALQASIPVAPTAVAPSMTPDDKSGTGAVSPAPSTTVTPTPASTGQSAPVI